MWVWDVAAQRELYRVQAARCLGFSPGGRHLATSNGASAELRDPAHGAVVRVLRTAARSSSLDFSPDGQFLVTSGQDGLAKVWDVAQARVVRTIGGHKGRVVSMSLSPDGSTVACADSGEWDEHGEWTATTVRLSKMHSGQELWSFEIEKRREAACVAFNPDGRLLASAAADDVRDRTRGHVTLWDVSRRREARRLKDG